MIAPPTASWVAYGLVTGSLVAAAAAIAEQQLRAAGRPARWVWAIALGLTVVLVGIAPQRNRAVSGTMIVLPRIAAGAAGPVRGLAWDERSLAALDATAHAVAAPVRWILVAAERSVPPGLDRWLLLGWGAFSFALLAIFAGVYRRFDRARLGWPLAELQGTRVRIAPDAGPAVVGLSRPEIVVPGWLLDRSAEEQRLVLAHEREHVRARDPLLLAAAGIAAVVVPWHPAVWWMWSRLRLAVEVDCDGRVLRQGVTPKSYGTLLIELAGHCSGLRIGAPALADESSHLEQRLIAMTSRKNRLSPARAALAATFATVALLAACEAKLPTQTEVNDMTAASAAKVGRESMLLSKDSVDAQYKVNGVFVSAAEANAITPERIASIEVVKGPSAPNGRGLISITTRKPGDTATGMMLKRITIDTNAAPIGGTDGVLPRRDLDHFTGIILVDGVRVSEAAMQAIAPSEIVSVEIIKGPSAASLYTAPEAKDGVIRITTKKGAAK